MLVSLYVVSPILGSLLLLVTNTFRSGEYQVSVVITRGSALPIWPASMVRVMRVPCAGTPSTVWTPKSVLLPSACPPSILVENPISGPVEVVAKNVFVPAAIAIGGAGIPGPNTAPGFIGGIGIL